jgi:hypothetical protein
MYPPSWLSRPAAAAATGWRLAALALGIAVLAGCGSVAAPGSGSPASPVAGASATGSSASPTATASQIPLCTSISQITRLAVVRSRALNRIQELHFPFPPRVIVTSPAAAQSVAKAVCALPRMPAGTVNCPMEMLGTTYQLTFTAAGRELPLVTANATGCEQVLGAGPVRQAASSPGFWQALGRAMDLVAPGPPVFKGNGPAASQCAMAQVRKRMLNGCPAMSGSGSTADLPQSAAAPQ